MTNINLTLSTKLDGSETHMLAILVDSWGDKLVIPLDYNKIIDPEEYFTPCAHCGNAVLECNFENGSDCCDRCNEGHKSGFVPPTKGLNVTLTPTKETTMSMEQRIKVARQEGEDAFWAKIVEHFPEAVDGSFLMSDMDDIMLSWVKHWVENNVPIQSTEKDVIKILQDCCKKLAAKTFINHGNTEPMLFTQVPFRGTCAILHLREITHPSETTACMDLIYNAFQAVGLDVCVIANDLSTLEINI